MMDVGLLPWLHNINYESHQELLDYISTLPNKSTILLECDFKEIDIIESILSFLEFDSPEGLVEYFKTKPRVAAMLDLYLKCKEKGIRIIPLESRSHVNFSRKKDILRREEFEKVIAADLMRERNIFQKIYDYSINHPGKLYVVTGAMHTPYISRYLNHYGINAKQVDYSKDELIKTIQEYHNLWRSAVNEGRLDKAEEYIDAWARLMDVPESEVFVSKFVSRLIDNAKKNNGRAKRRLLVNKLRQAKVKKGIERKEQLRKQITKPRA